MRAEYLLPRRPILGWNYFERLVLSRANCVSDRNYPGTTLGLADQESCRVEPGKSICRRCERVGLPAAMAESHSMGNPAAVLVRGLWLGMEIFC